MSKRWRAALAPATLIVIVTGGFHLYRGAPLDGVVFLAVGAGLLVDGLLRGDPAAGGSSAGSPAGGSAAGSSAAGSPAASPARVPRIGTRRTSIAGRIDPLLPDRRWCAVVCAAAAIAAGSAARYSIADVVLVLAIGSPVFAAVWPERAVAFAPDAGRPVLRASWAWTCVGLAAALWELTAYLPERSPSGDSVHPSISDLVDPVLDFAPARAGFAACWVVAGYGLLRWRRRP